MHILHYINDSDSSEYIVLLDTELGCALDTSDIGKENWAMPGSELAGTYEVERTDGGELTSLPCEYMLVRS